MSHLRDQRDYCLDRIRYNQETYQIRSFRLLSWRDSYVVGALYQHSGSRQRCRGRRPSDRQGINQSCRLPLAKSRRRCSRCNSWRTGRTNYRPRWHPSRNGYATSSHCLRLSLPYSFYPSPSPSSVDFTVSSSHLEDLFKLMEVEDRRNRD